MLTSQMREMLERAEKLEDYGADGVFPTGQQWQTVRALQKRGLLKFVGLGSDIDGDRENVDIFALTDAGREVLAAPVCDGGVSS